MKESLVNLYNSNVCYVDQICVTCRYYVQDGWGKYYCREWDKEVNPNDGCPSWCE